MPQPYPLSIRSILLLTISVLALLVVFLAGREVYIQWHQLQKVESLKAATFLGDGLFETSEKFSIERHITYSLLHVPDFQFAQELQSKLTGSRKDSDAALQSTLEAIKNSDIPALQNQAQTLKKKFDNLKEMRSETDKMIVLPIEQRDPKVADRWFRQSTDIITETQNLWQTLSKNFVEVNSVVTLQMRFKYSLWLAAEYAARGRSVIGRLITENVAPTTEEQAQLLRWQAMYDLIWNNVYALGEQSQLTPAILPYMKDAQSDYENVDSMVHDLFYVPGLKQKTPYPISGALWLELTTQANDSLHILKGAALKQTRAYVGALEVNALRDIITRSLILLFTLMLGIYSFYVVIHRVLYPINIMIDALVNATQGKPIPQTATLVQQEDEISKLAQVLGIFQKKFDELKRSNQELENFAYIASHDLKEPLRGMSHYSSFLLEDYKSKLDNKGVLQLKNIVSLSQRMDKLINDLLYYSRLGLSELALQDTDPNEVIDDIQKMMVVFLQEHNAHIIIPKRLPHIFCDKIGLTEIFRNLITNAVKYNDKKEKIVEVGYIPRMKTPHGDEEKVFYVKDNGVGIEPEFHEIIFRIFKRLENPIVRHEEGTGSGLTFVKKIIERHKGHVWLESEPGKGSVFYFTLQEKEGLSAAYNLASA